MGRKKKLPPNIRQKSNGSYEARKRINGVEINLCNNDLDELIKEFELAKKKLVYSDENVKSNQNGYMSLNEWFEKWFTTYRVPYIKETSVAPMKNRYYRTFGQKLGQMSINSITNYDIQNAIAEMKKEGKVNSATKEAFARVRDCLESAKNNKMIDTNPCFDIIVPRERKKPNRRFLTVEEQNNFLETAKFDREFYYPMFMIMFQTGLRIGEVGGLKWSDVDFINKKIYVRRSLSCHYLNGVKTMKLSSTKTINSVREIPFLGNVEEMFNRQKAAQDKLRANLGSRYRSEYDDMTNLVFTTSMGSPMTRYTAEKEINKVVKAYNEMENFNAVKENRVPKLMEHVHPHAIRRTFCTRCFESNMNPKVVQKLMGHATYSTTIDIYTDVMKDKMDEEVLKFDIGFEDEE